MDSQPLYRPVRQLFAHPPSTLHPNESLILPPISTHGDIAKPAPPLLHPGPRPYPETAVVGPFRYDDPGLRRDEPVSDFTVPGIGQSTSVSPPAAGGALRVIEAKRTTEPVPSMEERVSHSLARRQASRKAREQQRRDRLKDALDRLALVVPHEYTANSIDPSTGDMGIKDSKVEIVESAIQYIARLKKETSPIDFEDAD